MATASRPPAFDFRLLVTPRFNEREQSYTTFFLLETTQQFSTFRYELSVQETRAKRSIYYKIVGLKAPALTLPASGSARFSREYDDLHGTYEVGIEGLDGKVNSFSLRISPQSVRLLKAPEKRFVDVVVDESDWLPH